jgi:hypothetical protein
VRQRLIVLAVCVLSGASSGVAYAHVSNGAFSHALETIVNHSAGVGGFNCGSSLWVAIQGNRPLLVGSSMSVVLTRCYDLSPARSYNMPGMSAVLRGATRRSAKA